MIHTTGTATAAHAHAIAEWLSCCTLRNPVPAILPAQLSALFSPEVAHEMRELWRDPETRKKVWGNEDPLGSILFLEFFTELNSMMRPRGPSIRYKTPEDQRIKRCLQMLGELNEMQQILERLWPYRNHADCPFRLEGKSLVQTFLSPQCLEGLRVAVLAHEHLVRQQQSRTSKAVWRGIPYCTTGTHRTAITDRRMQLMHDHAMNVRCATRNDQP